jgi:hypothetical protein
MPEWDGRGVLLREFGGVGESPEDAGRDAGAAGVMNNTIFSPF